MIGVQTNFKRWNDSLQTKDPKTVANMYHGGELSFLPTVSPVHIKDTSNTEEYFVAFVQKNPFGTITDDSIQVYGNGDAYLHSGMYTFELGTGADRAPVQARFSYVWKNINGEWKITHHHSSVRPAGPNMLQVARVSSLSLLHRLTVSWSGSFHFLLVKSKSFKSSM
jgi:uncharacterized protein (TIGR02246 family)